MTNNRRDSKGRVLRNGEGQRSDGKYMFRYTDEAGNRRTVYSWKLVDTDSVPKGRRCGASLRELEKGILRDLDDGIKSFEADRTTINDQFEEFMAVRTDLKITTRANYICLYDTHIRNKIGYKKISQVKPTDIKKFYISLANEKQLSKSTIEIINAILLQLFRSAVMDDLIRSNPAIDVLASIKGAGSERKERQALTIEQQEAFVNYVYASKKYERYAPLFTVMLGTGMRLGEVLGLLWKSCDFKNNVITVDHTLSYRPKENGDYEYRVSTPKTKAGIRIIPMLSEVRYALIYEHGKKNYSNEPFVVDGVTGFIFLNSKGKVYTQGFIYDVMQNIVTDYNKEEVLLAKREDRPPVLIPKISPHILRHTFCTRLCESKTDIQDIAVIKEVMGHKNIKTTMDVYNSVTELSKQSSFKDLEGKLKLV